jgi:sorbose reductase
MYLEELFSLKGKVALVTGGGRGIGQVVAQGLAKAGAEIAIISRTGAAETVELIKKDGGKAYDLLADVTNEQEVDKALNEVYRRSGSLDIVFNNSGICIHKEALEASIEEWKSVIDTNLTGAYIVARSAARIMIENKIAGSIINNASMSGSIVNIPQMQASYNTSKAGMIHLTRSLAIEWAKYNIRVNAVSPGYIATPMSVDTPKELRDAWMKLIPFNRMGEPEELNGIVIFLASQASTYMTGSNLVIDGGYSCL